MKNGFTLGKRGLEQLIAFPGLRGKWVLILAVGIVLAGACLRVGYRALPNVEIGRDEKYYVERVELMASQPDAYIHRASNTLIVVGEFFQTLGLPVDFSLRAFNLAVSCAWIVVLYGIGAALFQSRRAGLLCMLFGACNPLLIRLGCSILREPLYLLFFSLGLYFAIRYIRHGGRRACWGLGLVIPWAFFSRIEGAELLLLVPIGFLCRVVQTREIVWKRLSGDLLAWTVGLGISAAVIVGMAPGIVQAKYDKISGYRQVVL